MKNKIFIFALCIIMVVSSTVIFAFASVGDGGITDGDCIHTFDSASGKCTMCGGACVHVYSSFDDYLCNVCGYSCQHPTVRHEYFSNGDKCTHISKYYCTRCDYSESTTGLHTGSTCSKCGATGCHRYETEAIKKFEYKNEDKHIEYYECKDGCGSLKAVEGSHVYGLGCKCPCGAIKHGNINIKIEPLTNTTHTYKQICKDCGLLFNSSVENCRHDDQTGYGCTCVCGNRVHDENTSNYTLVYTNYSSARYHYVEKSCDDCVYISERVTEAHSFNSTGVCSSCSYVCSHYEFDSNYKCTNCGFQCPHSSYDVTCTYLGNNKHNDLKKCSVCSKEFINAEVDCSFETSSDGLSAHCIHCTNSHTHTFSNGICTNCSYACSCSSFEEYITYIGGNKHRELKECSVCHKALLDYTIDCTFIQHDQEKYACCSRCGNTHTHSYVNEVCSDCFHPCSHYLTYEKFVYEGVTYDDFFCSTCFGTFARAIDPWDSVTYFERLQDVELWNMRSSGYKFEEKDGVRYPYQRFTISNFYDNSAHSATLNIVGGTHYAKYIGDYEYSRYAVFRIRFKDISTFEFDIWATDVYNNERISTLDMRVLHNASMSNLTENKWIYIVLDMDKWEGKNPTLFSSSGGIYKYLRLSLCCQFESADGYIDVDFVALAKDNKELDFLCSTIYDEAATSSYYVYESRIPHYVTETHSFSSEHCVYCGYACPHTAYSQVLHMDETHCGYDDACKRCDRYVEGSYSFHVFTDNSTKCDNCEWNCYHDFVNSYCKYCTWHCQHRYEDGHIKCIFCGMYFQAPPLQVNDGFYKLVTSIYDGQVNVFYSLLGYEILGVNIASMLIALIGFAIVIFVLKKVL